MNNNIYIKYYLLLLIPLIENVCSFNLINSFFVNKRVVNNPIKMCSVGLSKGQFNSTASPYRTGSSNYYLDNFMNNFIKNNNVQTNNFIDTVTLSSSNKIKTNYYLDNLNMNNFMNNFIDTSLSSSNKIKTNTYYVDDLLIQKNFTRIILNLRKGNNSLYYINETINNSDELYS
jgi:hypothetical protein